MEEGRLLNFSEKKRGELGVGIGLKWGLLSEMQGWLSNTLLYSLFTLELDEMPRRREAALVEGKSGLWSDPILALVRSLLSSL